MIKNVILFLISVFSVFSCQENKKGRSKAKTDDPKIIISAKAGEKPETVALNFYKWYLKDIYLKRYVESPEIVLNDKKIYVIDSKKHKKFLDRSGYFSPTFYKNELIVYKNCENKLRFVNWQEIEESGAVNPAENVEGNDCNFTSYMIWTNGQGEVLNKAKLLQSRINGEKALVKLQLSDTISKSDFSQPLVSMVKEKGRWKIAKIEVTFD